MSERQFTQIGQGGKVTADDLAEYAKREIMGGHATPEEWQQRACGAVDALRARLAALETALGDLVAWGDEQQSATGLEMLLSLASRIQRGRRAKIEWGLLDTAHPFAIEFLPDRTEDG